MASSVHSDGSESESSGSTEPPYDCTNHFHLFDLDEVCDLHHRSTTRRWEYCDNTCCPHRYTTGQGGFPRHTWGGIEVDSWQENFLFASAFSGSDPPTLEHFILLPESGTSSPVLSPEVEATQLPFDVFDTEPDFESSEQDEFIFLTLTMGDLKPDSVPKLSSASQYAEWSAAMRGYLIFIEAWPAILAEPSTDADYKKNNARCQGVIMMRTDRSIHHLLEQDGNLKSAKEMWTALKTSFGSPDAAFVWSLFQSLIKSPEMLDSKPMQDQINKIVTRLKEIVDGGIKLEGSTQALLILSKVPESYQSMVSALMATQNIKDLKVDTVVSKILAEESLRRSGMGQSASKTSQVKHKSRGPCRHCGGKHGEENCWSKYPHLRPKNKGGDKGKSKDKKGKGKGNGQSGSGSGNGQSSTNVVTSSDNSASAVTVLDSSSSTAANVMTASWCVADHSAGGHGKMTDWIMDSGASSTITNCLEDFWEYMPYTTPEVFATAGKTTISALGKGTIKGIVTVNRKQVFMTITNVSYIPAASQRLFSTGMIETSGFTLVQGRGRMVIYNQLCTPGDERRILGKQILEGVYRPSQNLYFLNMEVLLPQSTHSTEKSNFRLWHQRFGHSSDDAIHKLPKHTKGVDSIGDKDFTLCEGCEWGKSHRLPFPPSEKRASEPLELVHTDEDGPMRTTAIGGWKYFISFLDDHSSLGRAYYLKQKSASLQAFEDFKAWAETQTGKKLKTVRSDRGGEYTSAAFTEHLRKYGIEHQKTMPGSPQQNGRAERWNRTIVEKAMSMLHHAGLSHGFWQLAVETAVHIYNRQPMRRLNWQCPITLWNGTIPDVSYFRVFGCRAFVHVQKEQRSGKLDKKAVEMIFVGYEPGSKGYRFWNPATRSIVVSRDVTFNEESFPARKDLGNNPKSPDMPSDDTSDSDSEDFDLSDIPVPIPPLNEPEHQEPEVDPEPVGDNNPPPPEPVPPPQPQYQRPRREGAGQNRWRNKDNAYGDEPPAKIDRRTDTEGNQQPEVDPLLLLTMMAESNHPGIPQSHREAEASPERNKWHKAEGSEYQSHMDNKTWVLVPRPKDRKVIKCRWVYAIKHDGRYKARLVAKGFTQVWGQDYHETFSPVARFESVRYLLAHAALEDWEIESMDVKTAFLNGDLDEEIYMEQPEGWVVPGKEDWVCLLKKAIYGLKQASRQWNAKIHKTLLDLGFKRTYSDAGVYVYSRESGDYTCIIILYVDDLLLMGNSKPFIDSIKQNLSLEYQMTDLGTVQRFLGLRIHRERPTRRLLIDQEEYINTVLERFQMHNCSSVRTPLPAGAVLEQNTETASDSFRTQYQSIIGSIMYAMLGSRPDIAFAVTRLAKYSSNPSKGHMHYAYYILRYLQGTKDFALCYDGGSNSGLIAYSDSDWAEDRDDRHSTSGFLFMMANCVVSWVSRRQPTVSLSSTEAEYKASSDCCRQMAWLRHFGEELGDNTSYPTPLCLDNQGNIFLAVNPAVDRRTKHIEIRYHYIREFYERGEMEIYYVASEDQLADPLTKNVPLKAIEAFRSAIGMTRFIAS